MARASVMKRFGLIVVLASCASGAARLQDFDQTSCDEFRAPLRAVKGKQVGPSSCLMQETDVTFEGRTFRRLDVGLDGTVEGFLAGKGQHHEGHFTNAPDLVFPQLAAPGAFEFAISRYERAKGASMTVMYPLEPRSWNGKMWVTAHGGDVSFGRGQLPAWHRNLDRKNPLHDLNKYDRLILTKGYVLVKTRRTTNATAGDIAATLEDGTIADRVSFTDSARYIMDFAAVAERAIAGRLGQPPSRTYFYGHASGASIGRGLNYTPGLNMAPDGAPIFDGVLADDAAAGVWLPVMLKNGKDVLLMTAADRARFVPQIDVTHQMNSAVWRAPRAEYLSMSALANARRNAVVLREKGLASKARTYEVRSASHEAGETLDPDSPAGHIDLSGLLDTLIDHLDAWVERGVAPPPARSDWPALRDADGPGTVQRSAIAFPEVACPLGVFYPYPVTTSPQSAFAPFSSGGLEPLDADGGFVDMNRNGIRDHRETLTQAWQRLGLLGRDQELTRARYAACVQAAAGRLGQDRLFSDGTAQWYAERAKTADFLPSAGRR